MTTHSSLVPRPCLSVVVPCFNEAGTVATLVDRVLVSPWTNEIVVVDDGSTGGTAKVLADLAADPTMRGCASSPTSAYRQGRRPAQRVRRGDRAVRGRAGR